MDYEIYTFGNGEVLNGVFNSIAMCLNGNTGTLFEPLKRMALILGAFWAAVSALGGDQTKVLTQWIVPMAVFMNVLFVPTTTVWINDPVTHYHQKVDNVPHGLAAFASYTSKIGYHITEQIEKVFTLPDDLRYQKSGCLFASDIMQQAKSFHITNADLAENMRAFVGQCVLYDALRGYKYTIDDLRNTDDIWGLISEKPSQMRSFVWRDLKAENVARARPYIITCKEGVDKFNAAWVKEISNSSNLFGKKIFGKNGVVNPKAELLKYLPIAYGTLGNIAKDASEIIKQQMMIYSIVEGVEANSTALGNAPNFAARRAYLQQRTTYETLGAMAGSTLPVMKAVLEAIIYAFFMFVIPLSMMPAGYKFLMLWGQSLLWLQMWAPLYAVLNYIMTMAAQSKTMSALSLSNEAGVTIASSVGLSNMNADISAMAGYLAMSIPFLSLALVKGVGSFVHMASHLGNVSQSSAGMAANEVTSGNLSFGNISEGNSQISNKNMLNHSMAASYKNASAHMQDGRSEITTMADGSQVLNVGTSNLPVNLNVAESQSAQLSQMASQSEQKAFNLSESSSQSLSSSYRNMTDLSKTISQMESNSDSARHGISTEQSQAVHKGANIVKEFSHNNQISEEKSAQFLAEASMGLGLGKNSVSSSFKNNLSASDQESYQNAERYVRDQNVQDTLRQATQASKDISHTTSDENAKRLSTGVSGSYEQSMSLRDEASKSFRQAEDYNKQATFTSANSATINANHNQQFGEWLAKQPADNSNGGTIGARGASHIIAAKPQEAMAYAQRYLAEQGLNPSPNIVPSGSHLKNAYNQEQGYQVHAITKDSLESMRNEAGNLGSSINNQTGNHSASSNQYVSSSVSKQDYQVDATSVAPSESHIKQEHGHQMHAVTRMEPVKNEAGNPGLSINNQIENHMPAANQQYVSSSSSSTFKQGYQDSSISSSHPKQEHQMHAVSTEVKGQVVNGRHENHVPYNSSSHVADTSVSTHQHDKKATKADHDQQVVTSHVGHEANKGTQVAPEAKHQDRQSNTELNKSAYNQSVVHDAGKRSEADLRNEFKSSKSNLKHEQIQQTHKTAQDPVKPSNRSNHVRQQVDSTLASSVKEIESQTNQVQHRGGDITHEINKNRNKGVNRLVVSKGTKELTNVVEDIKQFKFGENQQR